MSNHTSSRRSHVATGWIAALAACALVIAACSSDAIDLEMSSASSIAQSTTLDEDAGEAVTSTEAAATTAVAEETTTTAAGTEPDAGDSGIAGEPLDFGPSAGTPLAVVGVTHDDTLNFRVDPSPDADIVVSHGPLSEDLDIEALGSAWAAPSGVWWMVDVGDTTGWANQAFLASLGETSDAFDQIAAELDSLQFETVEAAALAVADVRASDDPVSEIVFAGEPLLFEIGGFATVDVIGLGDDSVNGERIRIDVDVVFDEASGEEGAQDVAYVVLTNVEISPMCGRGLTGGLCI